MEPFVLTTDRLELRPFGPGDTDEVFRTVQDPDILRWTSIPSPYRREDAVHFVERISGEGLRTASGFHFAVRARGGGPLLAAVGVGVHLPPGVWELGFWTAKEHRRRGYVTEAAAEVVRWALTTLPVDRLLWRAEVGNEPSRTVAVRLGFTMEGVARAGTLHQGTARDAWTGSLLPSDLGLPGPHLYLPAGGGGALRGGANTPPPAAAEAAPADRPGAAAQPGSKIVPGPDVSVSL
ncbi:GNAT family N-acetyltransferase [Streptomyces sp. NPDC058657]|uniref:GNAT family N-acetyltransferase n=1 Tax=unclassified Streptomyces TaxID=2593676 RepID=UPI00365F69D9